MKSLLKKLLFKNQEAKQYKTYQISDGDIIERVLLRFNNKEVDISERHFVFCQQPFLVGIWSSTEIESDKYEISIYRKTTLLSVSKMTKFKSLDYNSGKLYLFKYERSNHFGISKWHQNLLIYFFYLKRKNKVTLNELNGFYTFYSYPRSVIVTCFSSPSHSNIFPMDLKAILTHNNLVFLGLRNTNITLKHIIKEKRLLVTNLDAKYKDAIYILGNHHSSMPPDYSVLPFDFVPSELYEIQYPSQVNSYYELDLIESHNLGSHTLLVSRISNIVERRASKSMYHQHINCSILFEEEYVQI